MRHLTWISLALCLTASAPCGAAGNGRAEIVDVKAIWGRGPHNAFTDLARFKDRWYCTFREGQGHVSPDGAVRILSSADGEVWGSSALLSVPGADLRDPKLSVTPDGYLLLIAAAAWPPPAEVTHRTMTWLSSDGKEWSGPTEAGDPNVWLWRVSWHMGRAYGLGYSTTTDRFVRIYTSRDGTRFTTLADKVFDSGYPNESSILFLPDNTALCLLRRDGDDGTAQLGKAVPPYRGWTWHDLGVKIGGPHMIRLPDGRIVAAVRLYDGQARTSLCWLDAGQPKLDEFLALPSGGDNSYPGLVFHDGLLWVSYYSSHEGKSMIYLARVRVLPAKESKPERKAVWQPRPSAMGR
jgi:hypothetical protein